MFRKVNLQSLNNFKKKNTEKQPTNSISEQRISVIPIQSNSGPKIHDIPKFKTQKTTRIFHSSQSKRNFSVKNLFTNDKTEDGKLIYEDFYINNFKKKPSLFNVKSRKFLPFEQESVNISVFSKYCYI